MNHIFNPSLLNSAKISYTRFNDNTSFDTALTNTPSLMLVSPSDPVTGGVIQMPGLQNQATPVWAACLWWTAKYGQPQDDLAGPRAGTP